MAITLVTTTDPFQEMLDRVSFVYFVNMDEFATTRHETLHTHGFGPCMVVVVHHAGQRGGGLAHLGAPAVNNYPKEFAYVEACVASILNGLGARADSAFNVVLIEGDWGGSQLLPQDLRTTFPFCTVTDRRAHEYRLTQGVVLYEPGTGKVAHYNDKHGLVGNKATPYAGVLRMQDVKSPYPRWQPDNERTSCNKCGKDFSFFRRRHHCRKCGLLFCYECSSKTKIVTYPAHEDQDSLRNAQGKQVRVCDDC